MARVAKALGNLVGEVVFIGGAVAPLLQPHPPFSRARPTKDVDATVATRSYLDVERLNERLRTAGFRQDPLVPRHLHRWTTPEGDWLDLVPAGDPAGGSGQRWDQLAIETSVQADLEEGVTVRHARAPAFLALKWAAFQDRGRDDPMLSHDLEDLMALLASRPGIVAEVGAGHREIAQFVAHAARTLLSIPELGDLLAGHLNNVQDPARVTEQVRERLTLLASAQGRPLSGG